MKSWDIWWPGFMGMKSFGEWAPPTLLGTISAETFVGAVEELRKVPPHSSYVAIRESGKAYYYGALLCQSEQEAAAQFFSVLDPKDLDEYSRCMDGFKELCLRYKPEGWL